MKRRVALLRGGGHWGQRGKLSKSAVCRGKRQDNKLVIAQADRGVLDTNSTLGKLSVHQSSVELRNAQPATGIQNPGTPKIPPRARPQLPEENSSEAPEITKKRL